MRACAALVARRAADEVDQPGEGLLDVAAEQVHVGRVALRRDVVRPVEGGLPHSRGVERAGSLDEIDLGEARRRHEVIRLAGEQPAVRLARRHEVARVEGLDGLHELGLEGLAVLARLVEPRRVVRRPA